MPDVAMKPPPCCAIAPGRNDQARRHPIGSATAALAEDRGGLSVKDDFFRKQTGCYIAASNEGGQWEDEHSPEACAQLCMADASCKSFDAGR